MDQGTYIYEPMKHPHWQRVNGFGGFGTLAEDAAAARAREAARQAAKANALEIARAKAQAKALAAQQRIAAEKGLPPPSSPEQGILAKLAENKPLVIGGAAALALIVALRMRKKK
jgi:hypothetical protein